MLPGSQKFQPSPGNEAVKVSRWLDEERVRRVLERYEAQSDEEAVAEDEAAYEATTHLGYGAPLAALGRVALFP
jgi:hypothetical protein